MTTTKIRLAVTGVAALTALGIIAGCASGNNAVRPPASPTSSSPTSRTSSAPADDLHSGHVIAPSSLIYALRAKGFMVTDVTPHDWVYGPTGTSLDTKINGIHAGLNTFQNIKDAKDWTALSQGFGGIAVVGDTWAVSMDSQGVTATPEQSKALAAKIAQALHAEVK
jgi:hypothetical protein